MSLVVEHLQSEVAGKAQLVQNKGENRGRDASPKLVSRSKCPIEECDKLITEEHREIARQFGEEYFDGERLYGYGGHYYHPRFWQASLKRSGITNNLLKMLAY